jgi:hypothetical protein
MEEDVMSGTDVVNRSSSLGKGKNYGLTEAD